MAMQVRVVIEERRRRGRRGRKSGYCSCSGRVALLLVVTADTHDAMFVLHSLVLVADRAHELQWTALIRHDQAIQHTSIAAYESVTFHTASAVVVQWSICLLTLVEADMLSAADREPLTFLHHTQHQNTVSAHCNLHAMHRHSVHVAAWG